MSWFNEVIDEAAGALPDGFPFREHGAALVRNAVIAAGWAGVRGNDPAGQETAGRQRTQHRINRAFLEYRGAVIGARQPFGYFVTVQIVARSIERGEEDEAHEAAVEFFLEFSAAAIIHQLILYS